jgi:hypothetical protein
LLSFATPLWLLGVLLVPLIWWLHRSGPRLRGVPVSSHAVPLPIISTRNDPSCK